MGARRGEARGALAPLEFEKKWCHMQLPSYKIRTLNFSLAIDTLYFSLKRRKKGKNFRLRPRRAEKWSIFCTGRRKCGNFLKHWWFASSLEKFLRVPMATNKSGWIYFIQEPIYCSKHEGWRQNLLVISAHEKWESKLCERRKHQQKLGVFFKETSSTSWLSSFKGTLPPLPLPAHAHAVSYPTTLADHT